MSDSDILLSVVKDTNKKNRKEDTMDRYKLEYEMKRRHISQAKLCSAIGMSRSAFYRKISGKSDFTLSEINAITDYLGVSPEGIFFPSKVS